MFLWNAIAIFHMEAPFAHAAVSSDIVPGSGWASSAVHTVIFVVTRFASATSSGSENFVVFTIRNTFSVMHSEVPIAFAIINVNVPMTIFRASKTMYAI